MWLWCVLVCACVSGMRARVHMVTASVRARHMGWLLGHVPKGWSSAVHSTK